MFYADWGSLLPEDIGIYPLQLKCRGGRAEETPYNSLEEAVEEMSAAIAVLQEISPVPYILFGHSMGGTLSYSAELSLEKKGMQAEKIFVSAGIPDISEVCRRNNKRMSEMDDQEFISALLEYGGLDERTIRIKEFRQVFMPVLRSDFRIAENYIPSPENKLRCSVQGYYGSSDKIVGENYAEQWNDYITGRFSYSIMNGGHFFINQYKADVCTDIAEFAGQYR